MSSKEILVLDIDSSSVGFFRYQREAPVPIIQPQRITFGASATKDSALIYAPLRQALSTLLAPLQHDAYAGAVVYVSSPWVYGDLETLVGETAAPSTLSQKTVAHMLATMQQDHADRSISALSVRVNGYVTRLKSPVTGSRIEVDVLLAHVEPDLLTLVSDALTPYIGAGSITLLPLQTASADACMIMHGAPYGTILSVHGDATDVTVLSQYSVGYMASVPIGINTFLDAVGSKSSRVDAASRLALHAAKKLAPPEARLVEEQLKVGTDEWLTSLKALFESAKNTLPVPHSFGVIVADEYAPWLLPVVQQLAPAGALPTIAMLTDVRTRVPLPPQLTDGALGIEALSVHTHMTDSLVYDPRAGMLYSVQ